MRHSTPPYTPPNGRSLRLLSGGCLAALTAAVSLAAGCRERSTPVTGTASAAPSATAPRARAGDPTLPAELLAGSARPSPSASASAAPLRVGPASIEWDGPWMTVTKTAAPIHAQPSFDSKTKIGYVKSGGRLPVRDAIASKDRCSSGWREVIGGGYVCMNLGSVDPKDPALRFTVKPPNLDSVLPYTYARNAKHGTPLYKSVPTPDQMHAYEPYLTAAKRTRQESPERANAAASSSAGSPASSARAPDADRAQRTRAPDEATPPAGSASGQPSSPPDANPPRRDDPESDPAVAAAASAEIPDTPWWQQEDAKLHEVTIETLRAEADDVLAQRMVEGFYVAIDKTFRWNNRLWYKTTKGLVAPADRFWQVAGPEFKGLELDGEDRRLPVGWVYGSRKTAPTYALAEDAERLTPQGSLPAFTAVQLEGEPRKIAGTLYWKTRDNRWIKDAHLRVATVSTPPEGLAPAERWVDVNVTSQTLVAYLGTQPAYATLVSSGKESTVKEKDHRTPRGEWRIREKHLTTTMDGDGSAAGDLPYSIEDVPYVAYFERSFALHGAFWHKNFGVRMSHGCVNLAPLDARYLFFFTEPLIPPGWHGVFATEGRPGSRVVVHE